MKTCARRSDKQWYYYIDIVFHFVAVVRIGFSRALYTYYEPESDTVITNVTIVKESNQSTEQQYSVGVTVSSLTTGVPATLESITETGDYSLGIPGVSFRQIPFPSNQQEIPFLFQLHGDEIAEGTEAFRAIISTVEGTPTFQDPITASPTAIIRILDNDCK